MADVDSCVDNSLARCANNCGFYANPGMGNLCSKCFKESMRVPKVIKSKGNSGRITVEGGKNVQATAVPEAGAEAAGATEAGANTCVVASNRCSSCNRKISLAGAFKCRCQLVFCAKHRHPEDHSCNFDYQKKGRAEISKANPVVKADKIAKI